MQHFSPAPNPPPLIVHPSWYAVPASQSAATRIATSTATPTLTGLPKPDLLIVNLFALRLARKLIQSLDYHPDRISDIEWLDEFLDPYDPAHDLAKITGRRKAEYLESYPEIMSRMKKQHDYPRCFTAVNPVTPSRRDVLYKRGAERREIIDFADAAREWGSTVLVPRSEAERMLELADQRRVADLEDGRDEVDLRGRPNGNRTETGVFRTVTNEYPPGRP